MNMPGRSTGANRARMLKNQSILQAGAGNRQQFPARARPDRCNIESPGGGWLRLPGRATTNAGRAGSWTGGSIGTTRESEQRLIGFQRFVPCLPRSR